MNININPHTTVGALVADDFNRAEIFEHLGIDYCCHGFDTLQEACQKKGLNPSDVIARLQATHTEGGAPQFASWPLDLLTDYILKHHHRDFHLHHDELLKVEGVHGGRHPELHEVSRLVAQSFEELDSHFVKEEQVLFPQFYELYEAHEQGREPAPFHCGSIAYPIRQMMLEHDATGQTWDRIAEITENFTTPADGCASYRLMNQQLYAFFKNLKEHVALENHLLFPGFIKMEQEG